MAWQGKSGAAFTGGSGQLAVMAELMHRKCNAAIPVVDIGTDVFAFRDDREEVARIQVKTATGRKDQKGDGYAADFRIPIEQLKRTDVPPLFYALAVRIGDGWGKFVVISRAKLHELWNAGCGSEIANKKTKKNELKLYIQFDPPDEEQVVFAAQCGKHNLSEFIDTWESLPPLKPAVAIEAEAPQA